MPFDVTLKEMPAGYALDDASGVEGTPAHVVFREFTSSEDGELFISRLDGWPTTIFSHVPIDAGLRITEIDHLLAIIRQDRTATIYVNELPIVAHVRATHAVEAGSWVTENDIGDIRSVDFGVDVPPDAGVLLVMSANWRKGLFFDFGPLNGEGSRTYDLPELLSGYFAYLTNQALFSLTEDDWSYLIGQGWFPFVGLPKRLLRTLIGRARTRANLDILVPQVRDAVGERLSICLDAWEKKAGFAGHMEFVRRAAERYQQLDYISATAIMFPRIEGLLRDVQQNTAAQPNRSQHGLSESVVRATAHSEHTWLMPAAFERYLKEWYFANFTPGTPAAISRNSVGHGVASASAFNEKAAALAFLITEQIQWLLPDEPVV